MDVNTFLKRSGGFTLIEMLVVLTIMSLMAGALLADFRSGSRNNNLRNSAEEMVAAIRQTQGYAFSGSTFSDVPAADFRLSFDEAAADLYKVCAASEECAAQIIETVHLPGEIYIANIVLEGITPIEPDKAQIIFVPPYGDAQFKGTGFNNEQGRTLAINLQSLSGGSLWVKINPISGRINYE